MLLGVAITKPAGSVSVKLTPVRVAAALGLETVKLKLVVPPTEMVVGLKAFGDDRRQGGLCRHSFSWAHQLSACAQHSGAD